MYFLKLSGTGRDLSLLYKVQTDSETHLVSYSTGINRPEREACHSLLSNIEIKNGGVISPLL
jgi:hypothetical protein